MSTAGGLGRNRAARPARQPTASSSPLKVVAAAPRQRPAATFVVFVVMLMGAGLVGLLLLNIAMQNAAFQLAALTQSAQDLRVRHQALDLDVNRLANPDRLALQATELGMVPNPNPVFLDITTGKVIGHPTPARAGTGLLEDLAPTPVPEPARRPQPRVQPR